MAELLYEDIVPVSQDSAVQQNLNDLAAEGFSATSWQEGSMALIIVNLIGEVQSKLADATVYFRGAFIPSDPSCTEGALTASSSGFFDNQRNPALEARHLVTLACASGQGPYTINVSDLVVSNVSPDGLIQNTFRNIDGSASGLGPSYPFTLASGTSQTFLFESETAGAQANVGSDPTNSGPTTTFALVTTLAGVTITSHTLSRSGMDEESDLRLLQRDQLRWSSLAAVEMIDDRVKYWAMMAAPAITTVAVDSTNPRGQGTYNVYVAELDSTANAQDVSLVQQAIDLRTFGRNNPQKTCEVFPAPEVPVDIAGVLYYSGIAEATAVTAFTNGLLSFIRAAPAGGYSFIPGAQHVIPREDIAAIIRDSVLSAGATRATVVLSTPTTDVAVPQFGKVIRGNWAITPVAIAA